MQRFGQRTLPILTPPGNWCCISSINSTKSKGLIMLVLTHSEQCLHSKQLFHSSHMRFALYLQIRRYSQVAQLYISALLLMVSKAAKIDKEHIQFPFLCKIEFRNACQHEDTISYGVTSLSSALSLTHIMSHSRSTVANTLAITKDIPR